MVDLSVFEPYLTDASFSVAIVRRLINNISFDEYFNNEINKWCNCQNLTFEGARLLQTNELRYKIEISATLVLIEEFGGDKKDYYYQELIKLHNNNLEFEKVNGFAYDVHQVKSTNKSATPKKKAKQSSLDFGDKPKKESAAERKLKAHAAKINSFKFTIKPVSNGN